MTAAKTSARTRSRRAATSPESFLTATELADLLTDRISGVVRSHDGWVLLSAAADGESVRVEATRIDIEGPAADEVLRGEFTLHVPEATTSGAGESSETLKRAG